MQTATTVGEYIDSFPAPTKKLLRDMRSIIRAAAPKATERTSYRIPTFDWQGPLVYFAGFKNHVSLYPVPRGHPDFKDELSEFKGGKGTAQFPLDQPLPRKLIQRVVKHRMRSNEQAAKEKGRKRRSRPKS